MPQNLNEALLRLELEVIGVQTIKDAAEAAMRFGAATKAIQPARVDTIIGAIDVSGPSWDSATRKMKEFEARAEATAAKIQRSFKTARDQVNLFADSLRDLRDAQGQQLVSGPLVNKSIGPVRQQVLGQVGGAIGLLPSEVATIAASDRLYRQGITLSESLNAMGSPNRLGAS